MWRGGSWRERLKLRTNDWMGAARHMALIWLRERVSISQRWRAWLVLLATHIHEYTYCHLLRDFAG
jgi:hypothetical protein